MVSEASEDISALHLAAFNMCLINLKTKISQRNILHTYRTQWNKKVTVNWAGREEADFQN